MNGDTFELALATALRDEAQEIAMSTDINEGRTTLDHNLDKVDAGRRRRIWITGLVAVAAAAAVIALVLGVTRPSAAPTPPVSTPTPTAAQPGMPYSSSSLTPPVEATLPYWTALSTAGGTSPGSVTFAEADCAKLDAVQPCGADDDLKLRLESVTAYYPAPAPPTAVQDPTYAEFLAHLDSLDSTGVAQVSDRRELSLGSRPATVMTLAVIKDAPGAAGCPDAFTVATECYPLVGGRLARVAVVDQGDSTPPTVLYISMNGDAPDRAERLAEFDQMLTTVSFG